MRNSKSLSNARMSGVITNCTTIILNLMKYAFEISDVRGDYLRDCDFRRFAGTPLRLLVTGFVVSAASNKCRMP
ncbi:MAG TPA: hypothetical protein VN176_18385, partial [Verrucomicrobiae bacterium]|nr:hypothetical protein [Verrucomicrobiae bacterium]